MKKIIFYLFIFIFIAVILFLNSKSSRYTGINYKIYEENITNFNKIDDFYKRHRNYKILVKEILDNSQKENVIISLSEWLYLNVNKSGPDDDIIDSHPWTVIERRIGVQDQFSDILSVLLVYKNIDSFYIFKIGELEHPLTFFKYNKKWSIIDPYYGIYFLNANNEFCSLQEHKSRKCKIYHLIYPKIAKNNLNDIFPDKYFLNIDRLNNYYYKLTKNAPTEKEIEKKNIYLRGGRSYIQKPLHRLLYQFQKVINLI